MNEIYLFNTGKNFQSYKTFGAFPDEVDGVAGYRFALWAPAVKSVSLSGDFNDWSLNSHYLNFQEETAVWTGFFPGLKQWQRYKYVLTTADDKILLKADPFARHSETRPDTASVLYDADDDYVWTDQEFMAQRSPARESGPLNIYEMHIGSWRRYPDGHVYNYRELAPQLCEYLLEMGYNAVEFMPLSEYPLDDSWGYQVTGYFSITSRYGLPSDFKYLVDCLHHAGIRVIMDWVPAHFPKDAFALARFNGKALYEYADPRLGEHMEWGTLVFDYSKKEVVSFLASSACFWVDECHIDGLRVDAVTSMLYLNYARTDFVRNKEGGTINLEALAFLQYINQMMEDRYPQVLMIAEESTAYPHVTRHVKEGGLGFTHKWNMGWMHDTLDYMSMDYIFRTAHHNQITFSMTYAFSENYVLGLSHDEVVHGKRSLLDRMPGDLWRKFASLRCMLMYQIAHPGAKLNFMGYEIGQFIEWRYKEELEWFLLQFENHAMLHHFVAKLNKLYLSRKEFWELDKDWDGFNWEKVDDYKNSVLVFSRQAADGSKIVCVFNLTPATLPTYRFRVPEFGQYRVLLNSDDPAYGGSANQLMLAEGQIVSTNITDAKEAARMNQERVSLSKAENKALADAHLALHENIKEYYQKLRALSRESQFYLQDAAESKLAAAEAAASQALILPEVKVSPLTAEIDMPLPPLSALFLEWLGRQD